MLTEVSAKKLSLADLPRVSNDSLIALIGMVNAEPRTDKIDVGVGVFRDDAGHTPILKVIKEAERRLRETQVTKAYLGSAGDTRFTQLLRPVVLGPHADDQRVAGLQTPGGCGALRLGFELLAVANPAAKVFIGAPTWPNHPPIVKAVGLQPVEYPYYERGQGAIRFEDMVAAIAAAERGDIVLLHGCCHNPSGADLSETQWHTVAEILAERGLVPFVDVAYQGFGRGLEEDAFGARLMLDTCDEVIIAQSCDKNFGVYRDRVGSLWIKTRSAETSATAMDYLYQIARQMWSMPPDHGAACVRIVLDDPQLREDWLVELAGMRERINAVRQRIASADPRLAFIGRQYGMFSMLPLLKDQVLKLRTQEAIYMADSGRFNVVGMGDGQIDRFIAAVVGALNA